jgi:hypothetical protein
MLTPLYWQERRESLPASIAFAREAGAGLTFDESGVIDVLEGSMREFADHYIRGETQCVGGALAHSQEHPL